MAMKLELSLTRAQYFLDWNSKAENLVGVAGNSSFIPSKLSAVCLLNFFDLP